MATKEPHHCNDWSPDEGGNAKYRSRRLSDLMLTAWSTKDVGVVRRYDEEDVNGVKRTGWAMWLKSNPKAPEPQK